MRMLLPLGAPFLALASLASPALALDELVLMNHHVMHGVVISSTPDSVTFEHRVDGQAVETHTFAADEVEPYSFYMIRKDVVADDPEAMLELGQFCLHHDLAARARHMFESAERLDPSLADRASSGAAFAREESAAEILARVQADQAAGRDEKAWMGLQELLQNYPDTPSGTKGKDLVPQLSEKIHNAFWSKTDEEHKEAHKREALLATVNGQLKIADRKAAAALAEKTEGKSLKDYKQAAQEYSEALKHLQHLAQKHAGDHELMAAINALLDHAKDGAVQADLAMAGLYMSRKSFQQATVATQHALSIDPDNGQAKAYKSRVTTVAGLSGW